MHLRRSQIFSILTDAETLGIFNTTSKIQRCKLTISCHIAVAQIYLRVSLQPGPCTPCPKCPKSGCCPTQGGLAAPCGSGSGEHCCGEQPQGELSAGCQNVGQQVLPRAALRSAFNCFNRRQHLHIKNSHHQGISVILICFT